MRFSWRSGNGKITKANCVLQKSRLDRMERSDAEKYTGKPLPKLHDDYNDCDINLYDVEPMTSEEMPLS